MRRGFAPRSPMASIPRRLSSRRRERASEAQIRLQRQLLANQVEEQPGETLAES